MALHKNIVIIRILIIGLILCIHSCNDFIEIDPPKTDLTKSTVFTEDATALASASDIYYQLVSTGFANGGVSSITFLASLSSDELLNYSTGGLTLQFQQFNDNVIAPDNGYALTLWSGLYNVIYKSNAIMEGLNKSSGVSPALSKQLTGEAKFMRAFCHFYLVNLFGDIPVITTTDYRTNSLAPRSGRNIVYQQIVTDLLEARDLLSDDYSYSNGERVRPNKWSSAALLARAYLYTEDWAQAEGVSTSIIDKTSLYNLQSDLNNVFLRNSQEAIWQLLTANVGINTWDGNTFIFSTSPTYAALRPSFVDNFEAGDQRITKWIGSASNGAVTYYFPFKYKERTGTSPAKEYSMVLRLTEQYLIRAEARAWQNKITEALADLDAIRTRAGLTPLKDLNPGITKEDLLLAILAERRSEFFTEWGHRWLDLKRTGHIDAVMSPIKQTWSPHAALYPIPQEQIMKDPAMANAQNPGY